jgi:hypothetical protein
MNVNSLTKNVVAKWEQKLGFIFYFIIYFKHSLEEVSLFK